VNDKSAIDSTRLELRPVGQITGRFWVPAYQRGYRWGPEEVRLLLSDIWENKDNNYCLQPVVVRRHPDDRFELIDGQQRLTTLYLIFFYMKEKRLQNIEMPFSLEYETRPRSREYLKSLDEATCEENIDFFHMFNAYQTIDKWFGQRQANERQFVANKLYGYLYERVQVIWYEADQDVDSTALFRRLNVGRIPLTNAELVKALLLARRTHQGNENQGASETHNHRQLEIAGQWDLIERDLHDDGFWAFLTNRPGSDYPTRIEFVFDLLATGIDSKDPFRIFLYFKNELSNSSVSALWGRVLERFNLLKEWYDDRDLFHKIGYLVAIGKSLTELIAISEGLTKSAFHSVLDERIRAAVGLTSEEVGELTYHQDGASCNRVLLLFNVESVRRLKYQRERYPFNEHKKQKWTLEHIHAQNAETLNKKEQWQEWLREHRTALVDVAMPNLSFADRARALVTEIDTVLDDVDKATFERMSRDITELLSERGSEESMHTIANLALLTGGQNSALSNSVFEVKRRKIIEMDREGRYIPICTRRAFLKYYAESASQQVHFWSKADRQDYLNAMISPDHGVLSAYLLPTEKGLET